MSDIKILVVEDEAIVMMELQHKLKSWSYKPFTATSGEDAIKKAIQIKPDLILMDIMFKGGIDGIEVIHQIKDHLDIPVIYLPAHSSDEVLERAKTTKPCAYLIKPFDERELQINIETALKFSNLN